MNMRVVGRVRRSVLAAALLFVGATSVTPSARAQSQSSAAAEVLYREAQKLMEAGKVHDACIRFAESQKLDPTNITLINLANCHEKEGKTASAWAEFTEAAEGARRAGQKDREKFSREHADALEKQLRTLVIEVRQPPAGTEIKLDGQSFGVVAMGTPLPVDPGDHELTVSAPKKKAWVQRVKLEPGPGTTKVEVPALEDVATEPAPRPTPVQVTRQEEIEPKDTGPANPKRTAAYIAGGAGIVALGAGLFFGLRAKAYDDKSVNEAASARRAANDGNASETDRLWSEAEKDHDNAKSSQTMGIVAGAVGVAALGTGIFLFVTSNKKSSQSAQVTPLLAPNTAGAAASFRF